MGTFFGMGFLKSGESGCGGVGAPVDRLSPNPKTSSLCFAPSTAPEEYTNYPAVILIAATGLPLAATNIFPFSIIGRDFGTDPNLALYMGALNIFIVLPQLADTLYAGKVRNMTPVLLCVEVQHGIDLLCVVYTGGNIVWLEHCVAHWCRLDSAGNSGHILPAIQPCGWPEVRGGCGQWCVGCCCAGVPLMCLGVVSAGGEPLASQRTQMRQRRWVGGWRGPAVVLLCFDSCSNSCCCCCCGWLELSSL